MKFENLTEFLSSKGTYIRGTLRKDRKRNPKKVISRKLKKDQMVWKSKGDMTVAKWKDKQDVFMISNAHIPKMTTATNRRGDENQKSTMVKDYNNSMPGIDRGDQILSYHSGLRKTLGWYKKAGVHISSKCFLQMCSISAESSPLTEICLTLPTSKKMPSNILLAKERRKLSRN